MPSLVSAGVFTSENDLSFVPQGIAAIGGAIIGLTKKGPAFQPVQVTSFSDFRANFGGLDPKMYVPYTAKNYLQNANILNVVRVLQTTSPQDVGSAVILAFPSSATATTTLTSSCTAMAVLRARSGSTITTANVSGTSSNFILNINGTTAGNLSLDSTSQGYIEKVLGTDPFVAKSGDILTAIYVESVFNYAYFASVGVTGSALANTGYASGIGGYSPGRTPTIISQNYNGQVYDLFYLETLGDGNASNTDTKISISMESSQVSVSAYPLFTINIRDYSDTDSRPLVLESFTCNLDPTSNTFIARVIGDRKKTFNTLVDPPEVVFNGIFDNKSKYIRVEMNDGYPQDSKPSGFKAIPAMQAGPIFTTPYQLNHLNSAGNKDSKEYMGFDNTTQGAINRTNFLVTGISAASTNIAKGFLIATLTSEISSSVAATASLTSSYFLVDSTTGSNSANVYNKIAMTIPFYNGWDGIDERKDLHQVINDGTLSAEFWNAVKVLGNPDELDFNLLTIPGVYAGGPASQGSIPSKAIDMITNRADAFYIADIGDNTISTTTGAVMNSTLDGVVETSKSFDTNYAAAYYPSVRILDSDNNKFVWVPASVVIMGAYAFNDKVGQPWFAPAGLNRGVLNVFEARKRLTQPNRDTLYLGKVNPIATFTNQGIVVWGQKTLQLRASALDRVNVRRLLITARKIIASVAKYFVFEPNDSKPRSNIVNAINPILEKIQKNQGLTKFKVVIDESNNTPDTIDRNLLIGDIFLQPSRTAEIFAFSFNITRTGVSFGDE